MEPSGVCGSVIDVCPVGPRDGPPVTVCGLALGAVEAGMPLRSRRMDSEGLAGSGGHWSTPRRFEAV
nr:MAG TPA: hypothetical protein [Caudoviricetes sp.]